MLNRRPSESSLVAEGGNLPRALTHWGEKSGIGPGVSASDKPRLASRSAFLAGFVCVQATRILRQRLVGASALRRLPRYGSVPPRPAGLEAMFNGARLLTRPP